MKSNLLKAAASTLAFSVSAGAAMADEQLIVRLSYIVDHPAIEATKDGILSVLSDAGFTDGDTIDLEVQSAQGSMPTQVQINTKFVGDQPDLIIAISTPSAQTAMSATSDIPIIFAAVTDPVAAGLVDSVEKPGRNLTGSSDETPIDKHVALMQRVKPDLKSIGVIYNSGEANSVVQVDVLKSEAEKAGLTVIEATAVNTGAVLDAARSLVGKADVIYTPTDSTVVGAMEAIVRVGSDADIPVIAADTASVERGAVAALGFNYFDIGAAAGQAAVQVLNGASPATIPVQYVDKLDLYVNPASAEAMGAPLSDDLVADARQVVK